MHKAIKQIPKSRFEVIVNAGVEEFSRFTYTDANTDRIIASYGISKGLLYHYFGKKKEFYLFCLRHALKTLTQTDHKLPKAFFMPKETVANELRAHIDLMLYGICEEGQ